MNKFIDVSICISETTLTWPGDPEIKIEKHDDIDKGDKANTLKLFLSTHSGTHIDAPSHFLKKGKCIEDLMSCDLIGSCFVKEISGDVITKEDLDGIDFKMYSRILFKTKNTRKKLLHKKEFNKYYVYLDKEAAMVLVNNKVKVIGTDYLSIEGFNSDGSVHQLLLKNNIIIIESLDLIKVKQGEYLLIALPLKIKKGDGAPSRVILQKLT